MYFLYLLFQAYLHGEKIKKLFVKTGLTTGIVLIVVFSYTYIERKINTNLYTLNRSVLCSPLKTCYDVAQHNLDMIYTNFFKEPWQGTPMAILAYFFIGFFLAKRLLEEIEGIHIIGLDSMNDYYMLKQADEGYLISKADGSLSRSLTHMDLGGLEYV